MKLTYNIALPTANAVFAYLLTYLGYRRFLLWNNFFWYNDLVYFLLAGLILVGGQFLLRWGKKNDLLNPIALRFLGAVDYILYSVQLVAMLASLLWEIAAPLLREDKPFSWVCLGVLLPIMAVDIIAMVFRHHGTKYLLAS